MYQTSAEWLCKHCLHYHIYLTSKNIEALQDIDFARGTGQPISSNHEEEGAVKGQMDVVSRRCSLKGENI